MRGIISTAIVRTIALSFILGGCNPFPKTWEWNQKLTIEVSTPDGIRSDSAVTNVRWQELNSVGNFPGSYEGEATVVELGDNRFLFALISEDTRYLGLRTFSQDLNGDAGIDERGFATMARVRGSRSVPQAYYPLLVTFNDIAEPATMRRVDPANLAATFGPGVHLRGIKLAITDEPVSRGRVEDVLPWLMEVGRDRGSIIPNPPRLLREATEVQLVGPGEFSTQLYD